MVQFYYHSLANPWPLTPFPSTLTRQNSNSGYPQLSAHLMFPPKQLIAWNESLNWRPCLVVKTPSGKQSCGNEELTSPRYPRSALRSFSGLLGTHGSPPFGVSRAPFHLFHLAQLVNIPFIKCNQWLLLKSCLWLSQEHLICTMS